MMHGMRDRDSYDAITTIAAILLDAIVIWGAQILAVYIRYDSGFMPMNEAIVHYKASGAAGIAGLYSYYAVASFVALFIYITVFQILKLYTRPQSGTFASKIPRLIRACLVSGCGVLVVTGLLKNTYPMISNGAVLVSFVTVSIFVLIERGIAFRIENFIAGYAKPCHRALILGTNEDAVAFLRAVKREPRLRTQISAIKQINSEARADGIPDDLYIDEKNDLKEVVHDRNIDQLVIASHSLSHEQKVRLVIFCEHNLVHFSMIPDLFRVLTNKMDFQMIGNIPLVGVGRLPLDQVWNRILKRIFDIIGGFIGLLVSLPFIIISAIIIKCESKGPVFYAQERCGRGGKVFKIYKLRTMRYDSENKPGWSRHDDPRRTVFGSFLRKWNIDEFPQFWNVLKGDMSLVGPRPEQPFYVEQFTHGIEHYMWRHVSKPGLTGWAQVNGYRGDTSISKRVKYDLYYLENWSLAFDVKIIAMTFFAYKNAE